MPGQWPWALPRDAPKDVELGAFKLLWPIVEYGKYRAQKKSGLSHSFLVLYARTPLTIVAHILPGRPVVIRPTLGAMGSSGLARYERAGACLPTAEPVDVDQIATTDAVKFHGEGRGGNC
jgi:hypothetical protein